MRSTLYIAAALCLTVAAAGCGGGEPERAATPAATAPVTNPVDPATAGSVTGKVTLTGTPPAGRPIRTDSDPNCKEPVSDESYMVATDGSLGNVFVYVKDGLGNLVFPVPGEPKELAQQGCSYRPHVLGIQVGQTLDIVSKDPTLHNVHAIPAANREFNVGQPGEGVRNQHVFSAKEVLVPFKCDVHGWMTAFVGVVDHPFYAVTGTDGSFSLEGLPPGTYTIEAVHEKLGRSTQSVTIGAKETSSVAFTFTI